MSQAVRASAEVVDPGRELLTMGALLAEVARRHGGRPALSFEGDELSYQELYARTRAVARGLVGADVTRGSKVALLAGNRPEWIMAAFAAGMVGAVLVPVSTFATREEREYIVRHSDASLLIVQDRLASQSFAEELMADFPGLATPPLLDPRLPALRRAFVLGAHGPLASWDELVALGEDVPAELVDALAAETTPADEAVVIYTSGTTARPKAVVHVQQTLALQAWRLGEQLRTGADDRIWGTFPFFWTAGLAMFLGATLAVGAKLVLQERFDAAAALELIERERATAVYAPPHHEAALADEARQAPHDLSSLVRISVDSPLRSLPGVAPRRWSVGGQYGASETMTWSTSTPCDSELDLHREKHGRPYPDLEFRIAAEDGRALPPEEVGEIWIRGRTLMRGYHKVPREQCFDADGFFHTGDAGYFDRDGYLHWTGRLSGLIKTGGANVSPLEIDKRLNAWDRVKTAFSVGVPHPTLGEAVVTCVVPAGELTPEDVRAHLHERIARYKLPLVVAMVAEEDLDFTGSQLKVRIDALRALAVGHIAADPEHVEWGEFLGAPASVLQDKKD